MGFNLDHLEMQKKHFHPREKRPFHMQASTPQSMSPNTTRPQVSGHEFARAPSVHSPRRIPGSLSPAAFQSRRRKAEGEGRGSRYAVSSSAAH